jgi:hypothetical protein
LEAVERAKLEIAAIKSAPEVVAIGAEIELAKQSLKGAGESIGQGEGKRATERGKMKKKKKKKRGTQQEEVAPEERASKDLVRRLATDLTEKVCPQI